MANSIVQNLRGSDAGYYGRLRAALANSPGEMGQVFAAPSLCRGPDYVFDALTEDAVAFTVWSSADPLNNSNAEVGGIASPALLFPANTLTPVEAFVALANDDTVGMIGVRALVLGSATAPTLVSAFQNHYTLGFTNDASGDATRVAARSTPGITITAADSPAGVHAIAFPICASAIFGGAGHDWGGGTIGSVANHTQPTAINAAAGTASLRHVKTDTTALTATVAAHIVDVNMILRETNGHVLRHTQDSADTADTLLKFGINTATTPDALVLQVTGITSAELRWHGGVWIGERLPIAFRTQA